MPDVSSGQSIKPRDNLIFARLYAERIEGNLFPIRHLDQAGRNWKANLSVNLDRAGSLQVQSSSTDDILGVIVTIEFSI